MDLMGLLLNTAVGAGGGFLGNLLKKNGLGMVGNLLAGGAGGNILPLITSALGLFASSGAAYGSGGGLNITNLVISLLGGSAGSLIGGLFKKA
jgi:hypothetical protein